MKTDVFQLCGHWWVFHICWHTECSTFTASSFGIGNSSTRISSPLLALFAVMLPKAHLMSGSQLVITPSWLCGLWRSFLLVLLLPSLNIFLLLLGPYHFFLYCAHPCMKSSLGISNFLEEISTLSHSIVFLYFFALITEEGFLISPCYSLELCIQMGISFLFPFAFSFSFFLNNL